MKKNNGASITVIDTDKGIAEHLLPQLFKPLLQLQCENISTPGTSLGLVLSKKIMELHVGTINVASEANNGTCVTLFFPITEHSESPVI